MKLPLSSLPAFLLAGVRAPGEKGRVVLGAKDTVQPVSRPQGGATMLPGSFPHQASLFLLARRCCFGGEALCAAGSAEGSSCSQGSLRTEAPTGTTLPLQSCCCYHHRRLLSPPSSTTPPRQWSGPLCQGREHSRSSCHGLAGTPGFLLGILPSCVDRTFRGKV